MATPPEVGQTAHMDRTVTEAMTADRLGNPGAKVYASPMLFGLLEEACIKCVASNLNPGQGTVGTSLSVQHLAPTPVGMTVTAKAELTEVDGRRLVFAVEAHDEKDQVAKGTHERFILGSMEKFLARAMEKASG